jgi:hypothetical protein
VVSGLAEPGRALDASALRDWAHSSVGDLITHIDEINRLNVFPVADSDTGVNMLFTMRSALAEANTDAKSADVVKTAAALSAGALNGARGNSGVILSQILRGIADVTARAAADSDDELHQIDAALLGGTAPLGRTGCRIDGRPGNPRDDRLGAESRRGRRRAVRERRRRAVTGGHRRR